MLVHVAQHFGSTVIVVVKFFFKKWGNLLWNNPVKEEDNSGYPDFEADCEEAPYQFMFQGPPNVD